jgi:hypothetical protein
VRLCQFVSVCVAVTRFTATVSIEYSRGLSLPNLVVIVHLTRLENLVRSGVGDPAAIIAAVIPFAQFIAIVTVGRTALRVDFRCRAGIPAVCSRNSLVAVELCVCVSLCQCVSL